MEDISRANEFTMAAKLKVLNERLNELMIDLAVWKIYAAVEVTGEGGIKVSVAKKDGTGFIYTLSPAEVLSNSTDPNTFIEVLANEVFEKLLKVQVRNELTAQVTRAFRNAVVTQGRQP